MVQGTKHHRRNAASDMEDIYVLWVHELPQYPQPSRWQELKDIIRDYSGGHVRKSDTIPPHHKTGFATIPGLEHAYLAFRTFQQRGWDGERVIISLAGPLHQRRAISSEDYETLPKIEGPYAVPMLPPSAANLLSPRMPSQSRHTGPQTLVRSAPNRANYGSRYPVDHITTAGPLSPTRERTSNALPTIGMPSYAYNRHAMPVTYHTSTHRPLVSTSSGYKAPSRHQQLHQSTSTRPPSRPHESASSRQPPPVAAPRQRTSGEQPPNGRSRAATASTSTSNRPPNTAATRQQTPTEERRRPMNGPLVVDGAKSSRHVNPSRRRHSSVDSDSDEEESDDSDKETSSSSQSSHGRHVAATTKIDMRIRH